MERERNGVGGGDLLKGDNCTLSDPHSLDRYMHYTGTKTFAPPPNNNSPHPPPSMGESNPLYAKMIGKRKPLINLVLSWMGWDGSWRVGKQNFQILQFHYEISEHSGNLICIIFGSHHLVRYIRWWQRLICER